MDKISTHTNLFRNNSVKVIYPCNKIKMNDKDFKCKRKETD